MPSNDRRRERREERDIQPDSDPEPHPRRRSRRPSESHRRRKGHRATDSTGELLPKQHQGAYDSSANSTPRRSRNSESASGPLSLDSLARLDAVNGKSDRKRGLNTYDEAYLQQVREQELKLEKDRKRAERRRLRQEDDARRTEAEEEEALSVEAARRREEDREKRRRERRKRSERDHDRAEQTAPEAYTSANELRRSKTKQPEMSHVSEGEGIRNNARLHEDWKRKRQKYEKIDEREVRDEKRKGHSKNKKSRVISGPYMEDGRSEKVYQKDNWFKSKLRMLSTIDFKKVRTWICIGFVVVVLILIIAIPAAVISSKKSSSSSSSSGGSTASGQPPNTNLKGISPDSIPAAAKGTYLDPFSWYDTMDLNVTYTEETVGGLPIMGLNSTWNDDVQANPNVPKLSDTFAYGSMPIRGMNVGGWLAIEPFITPSFFSKWNSIDKVVDEWTLTQKLGTNAAATLEKHYSSFINFQSFADIRAAGFDHVRIPFSYWAVTTYQGDPYVAKISFRYLLRGIEYARQNGLRVNLDLHGAPGSQNGWNHSGHQGAINWLNGTDGALNAQRTLDIHNQLSQFFAQDRYKNIITIYGLVNEPKMAVLKIADVVSWTDTAVRLIRKNGLNAIAVFGDGFLGLDSWKGQLQGLDNLLLDVHEYVIFNDNQILLPHTDKLTFACNGWTAQMQRSMNKNTGFGPTICGEWSQADTDCAQYLNNVNVGSRWEGTLNAQDGSSPISSPRCPSKGNPACECTDANADPSKYSAPYKQFLLSFAEAQMFSFEQGWGWFYWTWETENAVQWSWKLGMAAGILPKTVWDRSFNCNDSIPDFGAMGLPENY